MRMLATLVSVVMLLADASAPADLHGKVVTTDGQAVSGASVMIYSASPKKGAATSDPFDYPECEKSATADDQGAFTIAGVDASLQYELLVSADGYRPTMLKKVDPARGNITAKLNKPPADVEPEMMVKGRVTDDKGEPIFGAKVEVNACRSANSTQFGGESEFIESSSYTNAKGEFLLVIKKSGYTFDLRINSRSFAPTLFKGVSGGEATNEYSLTPGASITGKVVKDGQPVSGVKMMLVQEDRNSENWLGVKSAVTGDDGKYTFTHVHADTRYDVSATSKSLAGRGALPVATVASTGDGSTVEVEELSIEPGLTVSGQLVASSGTPAFDKARLTLSRNSGWDDGLEATADKDGKFEFKNVAADGYNLQIRLGGFHPSKENTSAEPYGARYLMGRVDEDITDLKIQLDPDPADPPNYNNRAGWEGIRNSRLTGVSQ
jgi:hypothetical protein